MESVNSNLGAQPFAGFWLRFAAAMIDVIIILISLFLLSVIIANDTPSQSDQAMSGDALGGLFLAVFYIVGPWVYYAYFHSSARQATLGKRILGIKVLAEDGTRLSFLHATGRFFAMTLSNATFGIGYFMAGWTRRKQALHDFVARTVTVKVANVVFTNDGAVNERTNTDAIEDKGKSAGDEPTHSASLSRELKSSSFFKMYAVVVVALLAVAIFFDNADRNGQNRAGSSSPKEIYEWVEFSLGDFVASVYDIEPRGSVGESFMRSVPEPGNQYVLVVYGYKNTTDKPISAINSPDLFLVDERGRQFSPSLAASMAVASEERLRLNANALSDLNPDMWYRDAVVFELPYRSFEPKYDRIIVKSGRSQVEVRSARGQVIEFIGGLASCGNMTCGISGIPKHLVPDYGIGHDAAESINNGCRYSRSSDVYDCVIRYTLDDRGLFTVLSAHTLEKGLDKTHVPLANLIAQFSGLTDEETWFWDNDNRWQNRVDGSCVVLKVTSPDWHSEINWASFEVTCELPDGNRAVLSYGEEKETEVSHLSSGDTVHFRGRLKTIRDRGSWYNGYVEVQ